MDELEYGYYPCCPACLEENEETDCENCQKIIWFEQRKVRGVSNGEAE